MTCKGEQTFCNHHLLVNVLSITIDQFYSMIKCIANNTPFEMDNSDVHFIVNRLT